LQAAFRRAIGNRDGARRKLIAGRRRFADLPPRV
jgi:hypothetical protein